MNPSKRADVTVFDSDVVTFFCSVTVCLFQVFRLYDQQRVFAFSYRLLTRRGPPETAAAPAIHRLRRLRERPISRRVNTPSRLAGTEKWVLSPVARAS